jgi:hypothetical protein
VITQAFGRILSPKTSIDNIAENIGFRKTIAVASVSGIRKMLRKNRVDDTAIE